MKTSSSNRSFAESLKTSAEEYNSIICAGYDPAAKNSPAGQSGYDKKLPNPLEEYKGKRVKKMIINYFKGVAKSIKQGKCSVGAFKPNLAYYIAYDKSGKKYYGSEALFKVLKLMREAADVPVILDAKDADIGRSSAYFAASKLKKNIDAMTIHPEMGRDSVEPFFKLASKRGQGAFVLTRTSNPGAKDFQDLKVKGKGGMPVYKVLAHKVAEWSQDYPGTVGSVVGGTYPEELKEILKIFKKEGKEVTVLVPGVGSQGGTADEVMEMVEEANYDPRLIRINSSSGIMYRAQKDGRPEEEHVEATVEEINRLNKAVRLRKYL